MPEPQLPIDRFGKMFKDLPVRRDAPFLQGNLRQVGRAMRAEEWSLLNPTDKLKMLQKLYEGLKSQSQNNYVDAFRLAAAGGAAGASGGLGATAALAPAGLAAGLLGLGAYQQLSGENEQPGAAYGLLSGRPAPGQGEPARRFEGVSAAPTYARVPGFGVMPVPISAPARSTSSKKKKKPPRKRRQPDRTVRSSLEQDLARLQMFLDKGLV